MPADPVILINISAKRHKVNIYIGNLDYATTEDDLRETFTVHGEVTNVRIINDRDTGRPKGFAFIEMSSEEAGQAAISALDGEEVSGRRIRVSEANPRDDNRGGGGGR